MGGRAGLRIAYSNMKSDYRRKQLKMLSLKKWSTGLQQIKITAIKNHQNNIDENCTKDERT